MLEPIVYRRRHIVLDASCQVRLSSCDTADIRYAEHGRHHMFMFQLVSS